MIRIDSALAPVIPPIPQPSHPCRSGHFWQSLTASARRAVVLAALVLLGMQAQATPAADYVEGEALVIFKPGTSEANVQKSRARHQLTTLNKFDGISRHHQRVHCHVRSNTKSTAALIAELLNNPDVEVAEPNYRMHLTSLPAPNDPNFSKLWALHNTGQAVSGITGTPGADIQFLEAWRMAKPDTSEIVVAVIDTGIDLTHPDLAANIWTNTNEISGDGIDDDYNGYVDDVHGYDFASNDADPSDSGDHGTHVSGIIAAAANNSIGVTGTAYHARIMPLKVSTDGSSVDTAATIAAINYTMMMKGRGVNIVAINASYGGGTFTTAERNAIQAAGNVGIVFCTASGNEGTDNTAIPSYPANYHLSNMIVVASSDANDQLSSFSNYGTLVDLAAPGENIYSTIPAWLATASASLTKGTSNYIATPLVYSGTTPGITGTLYYCGLGYPADFPAAVTGNIALIERGTLYFWEKITNAMNAGAKAAVVYNKDTSTLSGWTLNGTSNWIPALGISRADGLALKAALPATVTLSVVLDLSSSYVYMDGTSMATPYVTAAVAFAARNYPSESATERVARILANVTPVASLTGKVVTGGRLNLARVVDPGNNGIPDWWEVENFGYVGIDPAGDPDTDGFSNLQEFLIGSQPNNQASKLLISQSEIVPNGPNKDFRLRFATATGVTYQVDYRDNLTAGSWLPLGSTINGTGDPATATDLGAVSLHPRRFYQVRISAP